MTTGTEIRLISWKLVVADRRNHPIEKKDLLTNMLSGRDPKTGQGLSDDNITKNVNRTDLSHPQGHADIFSPSCSPS